MCNGSHCSSRKNDMPVIALNVDGIEHCIVPFFYKALQFANAHGSLSTEKDAGDIIDVL